MKTDTTLARWSSPAFLLLLVAALIILSRMPSARAWADDWATANTEHSTTGRDSPNWQVAINASGVHRVSDTTDGAHITDHPKPVSDQGTLSRFEAEAGRENSTSPASFDDGEIHGTRAIDERGEVQHSGDTAETATYLAALGWISLQHHKYKEAEASFSRALQLRVRSAGSHNYFMLEALLPLAVALDGEGKYPQAESLYKRALPLLQKAVISSAIEHDTNLLVKHLADNLTELDILPMALARREKDEEPEHLAISTRLGIQVLLQAATMSFMDENPQLAKKALTVIEDAKGPAPDDVPCLINLARSYGTTALHPYASEAEQEKLYKAAVARAERIFGETSRRMMPALLSLAIFEYERGELKQAESICKRALALGDGDSHPSNLELVDGLDVLSYIYRHQGRYNDARGLSDRALKFTEAALGSNHVELGRLLLKRAILEASDEDYRAAERYCDQAESVIGEALGRGHAELAWVMRVHARILQKQAAYHPVLSAVNNYLMGCLPLRWLEESVRSERDKAAGLKSASRPLAETYKMVPAPPDRNGELALVAIVNLSRLMVLIGILALVSSLTPLISRTGKTKLCSIVGAALLAAGLGVGLFACLEMQALLDCQPDTFYFQ